MKTLMEAIRDAEFETRVNHNVETKIVFNLSYELKEKLRQVARDNYMTMSQFIRMVLERAVDRYGK